MTDDRAFKRAIRRRMELTGEKYTDARRALLREPVSDELTGLGNERQMERVLERELARRRPDTPLGLVQIELGGFEWAKRACGRPQADQALVRVAGVLRALTSAGDKACRIDGEKFMVVLPGKDLAGATLFAERVRDGIERVRILRLDGGEFQLSASFGAASAPESGATRGGLFGALYRAKRAGELRASSTEGESGASGPGPRPYGRIRDVDVGDDARLGGLLERRFTERSQQVVVLAQDEARVLMHEQIGTEHILLGLLREGEGLAARVLQSLDITVERVRARLIRTAGPEEQERTGPIPFTPPATKVLEFALREALSLGHNYIGTEHILLALVREEGDLAGRILLDLDASRDRVREGVILMLSGPAQARPTDPGGPARRQGMFERFTERARQVLVLAEEEARVLKHNYVGTEHILLGLLGEKEGLDLAARVLGSLDITVERVHREVVRLVGSGEQETDPGQIPFTPRAKKVLEVALREALLLGHNYIGTEHILLGLALEEEGVAARVLVLLDADSETIRIEVGRMLSGPGGEPEDSEPQDP